MDAHSAGWEHFRMMFSQDHITVTKWLDLIFTAGLNPLFWLHSQSENNFQTSQSLGKAVLLTNVDNDNSLTHDPSLPIRGQYHGHVFTLDQSEASITHDAGASDWASAHSQQICIRYNNSISGDWAPPHSASHPQLRFTLAGRVTGTLVPLPDSADTVCTLQPPVNIPRKLRWTNWRFEQKIGVLSWKWVEKSKISDTCSSFLCSILFLIALFTHPSPSILSAQVLNQVYKLPFHFWYHYKFSIKHQSSCQFQLLYL